ncbi:RNA pyrophosphohydrolase [Hyalomma marginatum]|uniref:RNA pyrophosphohydrolase n=1 Tax=Hyalomma marginatum TaxID=34627 RepID=A0A8S4BVN0_9ACAR|nr:RNA pyrophosphohydrolase [Hyalomma marginatum]CAG7595359.1 RNA pyrophosphohydrolase [Hyalomma marginatum]
MMTKFLSRKKYRPGVGIILLNQKKQVFIGQRVDSVVETWQMPQGGIDGEEAPLEAALRELMEEVGTDDVELIQTSTKWYYYDLPTELQPILWDNQYVGQKQKWFLFKYLGADTEINIKTKQPEFIAWKWTEFADLPNIIVYFKKQLYLDLVEEFESTIKNLA